MIEDPVVQVTPLDVRRSLGIELSPPEQIADILDKLEFKTSVKPVTWSPPSPPTTAWTSAMTRSSAAPT